MKAQGIIKKFLNIKSHVLLFTGLNTIIVYLQCIYNLIHTKDKLILLEIFSSYLTKSDKRILSSKAVFNDGQLIRSSLSNLSPL